MSNHCTKSSEYSRSNRSVWRSHPKSLLYFHCTISWSDLVDSSPRAEGASLDLIHCTNRSIPSAAFCQYSNAFSRQIASLGFWTRYRHRYNGNGSLSTNTLLIHCRCIILHCFLKDICDRWPEVQRNKSRIRMRFFIWIIVNSWVYFSGVLHFKVDLFDHRWRRDFVQTIVLSVELEFDLFLYTIQHEFVDILILL